MRLHSDENIKAIQASLREFGQRKPIVLDAQGQVIAGCGTLESARQMGWKEIACVESHLDGLQAESYAIADNKTTDMSEFDFEMLASTLKELQEGGHDLSHTGFQSFELEPLLTAEFTPPAEVTTQSDGSQTIRFTKEQWDVISPMLQYIEETQAEAFDVSNPAACVAVMAYFYNQGTSKE